MDSSNKQEVLGTVGNLQTSPLQAALWASTAACLHSKTKEAMWATAVLPNNQGSAWRRTKRRDWTERLRQRTMI
eukprot:4177920-Amphidinium_carterae.1